MQKVTLSLDKSTVTAIDHYMKVHSLRKREDVIELALELLKEADSTDDEYDDEVEAEHDEDSLEYELGVTNGFDRDDDRW